MVKSSHHHHQPMIFDFPKVSLRTCLQENVGQKKKKNEALVKLSNMPKASKPGLPTENLELLTPI